VGAITSERVENLRIKKHRQNRSGDKQAIKPLLMHVAVIGGKKIDFLSFLFKMLPFFK